MFMTPTITNAMKFITYTALGVDLNKTLLEATGEPA